MKNIWDIIHKTFFLCIIPVAHSTVAITSMQYGMITIESALQDLLSQAKIQPLSLSELFEFQSKLVAFSRYNFEKAEAIKKEFAEITKQKTKFPELVTHLTAERKTPEITTIPQPTPKETTPRVESDVIVIPKEGSALDVLIKKFNKIAKKIEMLEQKTITERMTQSSGYLFLVNELQAWQSEFETAVTQKHLSKGELFEFNLESYKNEAFKELTRLIFDDLKHELEPLTVQEQPHITAHFPYYQIVRIKEATKKNTAFFLSSEALYGNSNILKDLGKFQEVYALFMQGNVKTILENKTIKHYATRMYRDTINMIHVCIFGKNVVSEPYNESSLASLIFALFDYVTTVEMDIKTINNYYKKYILPLYQLLIDYTILFTPILDFTLENAVVTVDLFHAEAELKNVIKNIEFYVKQQEKEKLSKITEHITLSHTETGKEISKNDILVTLPKFTKEVEKKIQESINNETTLTEQIVTAKGLAYVFDQSLCQQGECARPFQEVVEQAIIAQEAQTDKAISTIVKEKEPSLSRDNVQKIIQQSVKEYGFRAQGQEDGAKQEMDPLMIADQSLLAKNFNEIVVALKKCTTLPITEKMNKQKGYFSIFTLLSEWIKTVKTQARSVLSTAQSALYNQKADALYQELTKLLANDLEALFTPFSTELDSPKQEDFPHYQIVRIREATKKRIPNALESPDLFGNSAQKNSLFSEFQSMYHLLENGGVPELLEHKTINNYFLKNHKKTILVITRGITGKEDVPDPVSGNGNLAALILAILQYINNVVENTEKVQEYYTNYVIEPDLVATLQSYMPLFESMLEDELIRTVIDVYIDNEVEPILQKLKLSKPTKFDPTKFDPTKFNPKK